MKITAKDVAEAAERIRGKVVRTPCTFSPGLSDLTGMRVFCKHEEQQRTGSFKERGARNALELLDATRRQRGVIAASAGNHALGLAWHARELGIPATVVMPKYAPLTKVVNCRRFGATVALHGNNIAESRTHADRISAETGAAYINGFDDPAIIAGQGTLALEILEQVPDVAAVVVPVGGGGLIAGMALALKSRNPAIEVIGVEPDHAASLRAAIEAGRPVAMDLKPTLADGLSVPKVGDNAFELLNGCLDRLSQVTEQQIARAILRLMELEKVVVEGAGAVPLAACLSGRMPDLTGKCVVLPLCGGNIDLNMLDRVIERGLVSEGRLCQFNAIISDRPGGLAQLTSVIAEEGASILEIFHDRRFADHDITTVTVHCIVETTDAGHIEQLLSRLKEEGYRVS